jgi:hypothetical protein
MSRGGGVKPVKVKEKPRLALDARLSAALLLTSSSTSSFSCALRDLRMWLLWLPLPLRPPPRGGEAGLARLAEHRLPGPRTAQRRLCRRQLLRLRPLDPTAAVHHRPLRYRLHRRHMLRRGQARLLQTAASLRTVALIFTRAVLPIYTPTTTTPGRERYRSRALVGERRRRITEGHERASAARCVTLPIDCAGKKGGVAGLGARASAFHTCRPHDDVSPRAPRRASRWRR